MKMSLGPLALVLLAQLVLHACQGKNPLEQFFLRAPLAKDATVIESAPTPGSLSSLAQQGEVPTGEQAGPPFAAPPPGPEVIPMPVFPPPPDDFGNITVLRPAFAVCGNNLVSQRVLEDGTIIGEECEDGNTQNGDGCSSTCEKEFCGNGRVEPGEQCDPGQAPTTPPTEPPLWNQAIPTKDCDKFCELIICGDGKVNGHEECDDCNRINCDGCSADCKLERLNEAPCNYICSPTSPPTCPLFVKLQQLCAIDVTCTDGVTICNGICCPNASYICHHGICTIFGSNGDTSS